MTALDKLRNWIKTFPGYDILADFQVDYTDQMTANSGGIFPSGLVEVGRSTDIMGTVTVTNQYNFGLYYTFLKAPGDDIGAAVNADWVMDFQEWVQAQSITGQAPVFGDQPRSERIIAQNGTLYEFDAEGMALYAVQLSVQFTKIFKEENKWLK